MAAILLAQKNKMKNQLATKVCVLGSYTPRQCGIASFSKDVVKSLQANGAAASAMAVDDEFERYEYPQEVLHHFLQSDPLAYTKAADFVNEEQFDVLNIQHEFGIYGGDAGRHITIFMRKVRCPIVTTLHTLLTHPTPEQRQVLLQIAELSDQLVVMSNRAVQILETTYGVCPSKITVIPHGIPSVPPIEQDEAKQRTDTSGRQLLFTFGLLSPDKGIEDMIRALPMIVEKHPTVLYVVSGVTHPHIRATSGERYREHLIALAEELGVSDNVRLENTYLDLEQLNERLSAADIYVTPYRKREQITSGTLAYAFGLGNAVVSTNYWHAEELLNDGKGVLIQTHSPDDLADSVNKLLSDNRLLESIQAKAFEEGQDMVWPRIGAKLLDLLKQVAQSKTPVLPEGRLNMELPSISEVPGARYLLNITDDVGTLQHAKYSIPRRSDGYCVDDCARAALVFGRLYEFGIPPAELDKAILANLAYLLHALEPQTRRYRNFRDFKGNWLSTPYSEDAHGRAIWALGELLNNPRISAHHLLIEHLFRESTVIPLVHTRSICYATLGICQAASATSDPALFDQVRKYQEKLLEKWSLNATPDWNWFEDSLTYDNAILCHALLCLDSSEAAPGAIAVGIQTLNWLCQIQTSEAGWFRPIGSDGFYDRNKTRAVFDQQPIDAWSTIEVCKTANERSPQSSWTTYAEMAFQWFMGKNDLRSSMIHPHTHGCYDGLTPDGPNLNTGAESTISLIGSYTAIHALRKSKAQIGANLI